MKRALIILISLGFLAFSCKQSPEKSISDTEEQETAGQQTTSTRDGIFIHITAGYDDPHRVLMPLKMANIMATDKDVLLYLDIHAVELVLKSSKDLEFADFDPLHKQLQDLIEKKVGIYVCPTCLKIAGHTPDELMEGVQVANKDRFFDFTDGRILTLDY
jgi:predicted peroxiredoxin